ncbi:MAG: hypothetical protein HY876_02545 [Coriobacteriales bacterium]|nr:hypothetical protein [Coriobacteriales bacterium]
MEDLPDRAFTRNQFARKSTENSVTAPRTHANVVVPTAGTWRSMFDRTRVLAMLGALGLVATVISGCADSNPKGGSQIPSPDGPFVVGVAEVPLAHTIAYFPAVAGTGAGHRPYLGPETANILGVAPHLFDTIKSSSTIDATPLPTTSPRPVVILTPGFASPIELSTSLAEQLASHGYIVIAAQNDLAAEKAFGESDTFDEKFHRPRTEQLTRLLDLLDNPALPGLVGTIDQSRIAVGGHSYAGWIAFDTSLIDTRITAVFNLDGLGGQNQARTTVPALAIASHDGAALDPKLLARSPKLVAVALLDAAHYDLTDAPSIAKTLGDAASPLDRGTIGPIATSNTSTVVLRFLDSTLTTNPRLPASTELIKGLPSMTADLGCFGLVRSSACGVRRHLRDWLPWAVAGLALLALAVWRIRRHRSITAGPGTR